jgi:hypothetical protein
VNYEQRLLRVIALLLVGLSIGVFINFHRLHSLVVEECAFDSYTRKALRKPYVKTPGSDFFWHGSQYFYHQQIVPSRWRTFLAL